MIETVLGPIAADQLGPTSMHDHLLADGRALSAPPREPLPADRRVTVENLGFLRWNLLGLEDNLVLDDAGVAVAELAHASAAGQSGLVDLTVWGLGPAHERLPAIARASGLHVMVGFGAYIEKTHPAFLVDLTAAEIEARMDAALTVALPGVDFRAALLGIVGTGSPIGPSEDRVLRAAGAAAGRAGAAVNVHLHPTGFLGLTVLERLAAEGTPASRVIFDNVDKHMDLGYLRELAAAGATLEWCFGNEAYYRDGLKDPTDAERLAGLQALLDDGLAGSCVLGHSIWVKTQLRAFGGMGYDHLLTRIVPELRRRGVSDADVQRMLVTNPRRLLDRDERGGSAFGGPVRPHESLRGS
jgi:phosphotriesterase-related protein